MGALCGFMTEWRACWISFWVLGCLKSTEIHLNRQMCLNFSLQFLGLFLRSKLKSLFVQFSLSMHMSQFCRQLRAISTSRRKCRTSNIPLSISLISLVFSSLSATIMACFPEAGDTHWPWSTICISCLVKIFRKKPQRPSKSTFFCYSDSQPTDREFVCNIYLGH